MSSFRDAPLGAGPESILPVVVMDSGLALRAPRNDELFLRRLRAQPRFLLAQFGRQRVAKIIG
jgi:hypothetical protein